MIENFVNFITDTITPPIINEYGIGSDFAGNDSSTAEYTKLGWIFKCYMGMKDRGLVDSDVINVVSDIVDVNDYEALRSPSGFNIFQIVIYDNRSNPDFNLTEDLDFNKSGFLDLIRVADNPGGQTPAHMIADYGMKGLMGDIDARSDFKHFDVTSISGDYLSPWALSIVRGAEEVLADTGATRKKETADIAADVTLGVDEYDDFFGKNPMRSGSGLSLDNEISRIIVSSSEPVLMKTIENNWLIGPNAVADYAINPISSIVVKKEGIKPGDTTYNLSTYSVPQQSSMYHPMFFYLNKYRSNSDVSVLSMLSRKFSPFSITITDSGETEGFNCIGLAAYYMSISGDEWTNNDMAGWIKDTLSSAGGDAYEIWAVSGNVRDFTGGSSSNAFGAITNILEKINDDHSAWWSAEQEDENSTATINDYESKYNTLSSLILPDDFDYNFYRIWMTEFGKEIE